MGKECCSRQPSSPSPAATISKGLADAFVGGLDAFDTFSAFQESFSERPSDKRGLVTGHPPGCDCKNCATDSESLEGPAHKSDPNPLLAAHPPGCACENCRSQEESDLSELLAVPESKESRQALPKEDLVMQMFDSYGDHSDPPDYLSLKSEAAASLTVGHPPGCACKNCRSQEEFDLSDLLAVPESNESSQGPPEEDQVLQIIDSCGDRAEPQEYLGLESEAAASLPKINLELKEQELEPLPSVEKHSKENLPEKELKESPVLSDHPATLSTVLPQENALTPLLHDPSRQIEVEPSLSSSDISPRDLSAPDFSLKDQISTFERRELPAAPTLVALAPSFERSNSAFDSRSAPPVIENQASVERASRIQLIATLLETAANRNAFPKAVDAIQALPSSSGPRNIPAPPGSEMAPSLRIQHHRELHGPQASLPSPQKQNPANSLTPLSLASQTGNPNSLASKLGLSPPNNKMQSKITEYTSKQPTITQEFRGRNSQTILPSSARLRLKQARATPTEHPKRLVERTSRERPMVGRPIRSSEPRSSGIATTRQRGRVSATNEIRRPRVGGLGRRTSLETSRSIAFRLNNARQLLEKRLGGPLRQNRIPSKKTIDLKPSSLNETMKVEGHRIAESKSLRNLPRALEERPIRLKQAPTHQRQRHAASHHENVRSRTIRALHKELSRLRTTHFELEQRLIGLEQEIEEVEREFIDFSMDRLPVEQSMRRNRIVRRRGQVVSKSGRSLNIASKGSATSKLSTGGAKQAMLTQKVASPAPSSSGAILNHKGPSDELDLESIQLQDNRKPDDPAKEGHLH